MISDDGEARYGDDAMLEAAERADQLLHEGGMAGAETWHRILNAIERLQAKVPAEGEKATDALRRLVLYLMTNGAISARMKGPANSSAAIITTAAVVRRAKLRNNIAASIFR